MLVHKDGTPCGKDKIFVFGSNLSGVHGAGAARYAHKERGFPWGVGEGLNLNSMSYAIPTKDENIETLPLSWIEIRIHRMIESLHYFHDPIFFTRFGCVLAGYEDSDIAPLLRKACGEFEIPGERLDIPEQWVGFFEGYPFD